MFKQQWELSAQEGSAFVSLSIVGGDRAIAIDLARFDVVCRFQSFSAECSEKSQRRLRQPLASSCIKTFAHRGFHIRVPFLLFTPTGYHMLYVLRSGLADFTAPTYK
jgi:hypothetical protein